MLPTKADSGKKHHAALERLVNEAMRHRIRRLSGYRSDLNHIRVFAFETLLMIEQGIELERISRAERQTKILMVAFGVKES